MATVRTLLSAFLLFLSSTTTTFVNAHGAIIAAVGDAGGRGSALGIDPTTPRDGTRRNPFQRDTTRFRGSSAATLGETLQGGDNQLESGTQAILAQNGGTLPQVTPGGELRMTLHQVNGDGGGPYQCMINSDGTATTWEPLTVTQNVPGRRGNNRVSLYHQVRRSSLAAV